MRTTKDSRKANLRREPDSMLAEWEKERGYKIGYLWKLHKDLDDALRLLRKARRWIPSKESTGFSTGEDIDSFLNEPKPRAKAGKGGGE